MSDDAKIGLFWGIVFSVLLGGFIIGECTETTGLFDMIMGATGETIMKWSMMVGGAVAGLLFIIGLIVSFMDSSNTDGGDVGLIIFILMIPPISVLVGRMSWGILLYIVTEFFI